MIDFVLQCEGCDSTDEGVSLNVTGTSLQIPSPECQVIELDYPDSPTYAFVNKTRVEFTATPQQVDFGWHNCWRKGLDGEVTKLTATWTGAGTWYPTKICFDWDKDDNVISYCEFPANTTLTRNQTAILSCSTYERTLLMKEFECPDDPSTLPSIPDMLIGDY